MLLVIAGIVVVVVQLVSGNEDSSPQQEVNPNTDLGRHYTLTNVGVDPSTNLSLTADLIPTSARAMHLRLKAQNGTFHHHFSYEKVNDTGGRGEPFGFGGAVGEGDPKTSYYYISNRGLINETVLNYLLSANMAVNERRTTALIGI